MKILVVDDEQDICEILQYNLETEGYEVDVANSAEEALELMHNDECIMHNCLPDLILLDVMMGEISGFQMARRLKDSPDTAGIPIIFITALDDEDNTVKGLNIGADDYIAKPLSMKEVKARVKAVLRRATHPNHLPSVASGDLLPFVGSEPHSVAPLKTPVAQGTFANGQNVEYLDTNANVVRYEGVVLNTDAKTATLDRKPLTLTKLEFELLSLLLQNPNRVFSRDELLKRCWPEDVYVLDRTVDVNITRLRKKLGIYGKQLKTRVGYGYIFEK